MNRPRRSVPWLEIRTAVPDDTSAESGAWQAELDGARCRSDRQFFDEAARALGFPAYFGHNWAAFDECFGDLLDVTGGGMGHAFGDRAGRPEPALHLTVRRAEHLLDDDRPDALRVLFDILGQDPSADVRPDGVHLYADFHASFLCAPEALESFTSRLTAAGLQPADRR